MPLNAGQIRRNFQANPDQFSGASTSYNPRSTGRSGPQPSRGNLDLHSDPFELQRGDIAEMEGERNRAVGAQDVSFSDAREPLGGITGDIEGLRGTADRLRGREATIGQEFAGDRTEVLDSLDRDYEQFIAEAVRGIGRDAETEISRVRSNPNLTPEAKADMENRIRQSSGTRQSQTITQADQGFRRERTAARTQLTQMRQQTQQLQTQALLGGAQAQEQATRAAGLQSQGFTAAANAIQYTPTVSYFDALSNTQAQVGATTSNFIDLQSGRSQRVLTV